VHLYPCWVHLPFLLQESAVHPPSLQWKKNKTRKTSKQEKRDGPEHFLMSRCMHLSECTRCRNTWLLMNVNNLRPLWGWPQRKLGYGLKTGGTRAKNSKWSMQDYHPREPKTQKMVFLQTLPYSLTWRLLPLAFWMQVFNLPWVIHGLFQLPLHRLHSTPYLGQTILDIHHSWSLACPPYRIPFSRTFVILHSPRTEFIPLNWYGIHFTFVTAL